MNKVIYVSGIGSNESSKTYKKLKEKFPDLIYINYNILDFKTENELLNYVREEILRNTPGISIFDRFIIGNSFGGRLSYQLSDICYKMILVNPAFNIYSNHKSLSEKIEKNKLMTNNFSMIHIFISKNDKIVDSLQTIKAISNKELRGGYTEIDEDHSLTTNEMTFEMIFDMYEKMENLL